MQLIFGFRAVDDSLKKILKQHGSVVTIGNFDGLHLGHQDLIKSLIESAHHTPLRAFSLVYTFEPHPALVLTPEQPHFELFERSDLFSQLESLGVDGVICEPFTKEFSQMPPVDFFQECLLETLSLKKLVVGCDFTFGSGKSGNLSTLEDLCRIHQIQFESRAPVLVDGQRVSSSRVRLSLQQAQMEDVKALLGRPYHVCGTVSVGDQRGRQLGFPTANMKAPQVQYLKKGVYVAQVKLDDKSYPAVVNIGRAPTFHTDQAPLWLEAHLLDFSDKIYGRQMRVDLGPYLRPEVRFSSVAALKAQIEKDISAARTLYLSFFASEGS